MYRLISILFVLVFICGVVQVPAQQIPINIESLSDEQLMQLISRYQLSGLSESELEEKAKEFGLSTDQILILKKRMALLSADGSGSQSTYNNKTDSYVLRNKVLTKGPSIRKMDSTGALPVFGADIFDNTDLSFEPNLSIATPQNYIIGVNDQLVIDVYGISDATKKLKVTTEGDIRFPRYGPIKVAGLTIEEARIKIRNALSKIYPGIRNGTVAVQVSLGEIRSIHITLLGEVQRPGSYTISALATLMNALYASGGPNAIGSFRDIELIRNGDVITRFDLYDFLIKGSLKNNLLLQDGDVIKVNPYRNRVTFRGAFKKPAIFDVKEGETAQDILSYAGGFADIGYKEWIRVTRMGVNRKEVISVKPEQLSTFKLVSGDIFSADSLVNSFANRVTVTGAVYHPGQFGTIQIRTLKDLMAIVQPREDAYLERALLRRYQNDFTPSFVNFNISDVINGRFNLDLVREDSIHIYERNELKERYTIIINGEVNRAGIYDFYEKMKVEDLVLIAGGYKEGASLQKIEVSRRIRTRVADKDSSVYSVIKEINLGQGQSNDRLDFELQPFDIVSVRRSPVYKEQASVTVEGEVIYPGNYTLSANNERLSNIVKRAGGVKANANIQGALLMRKTYAGISASDAVLLSSKANLANLKSGKQTTAANDSALLKDLSDQQKPVGIRLDLAIQNPGSAEDLFLVEGDVLKIPTSVQTIQTFGMVSVPKQIVYREGLTFKDAINESGGFAGNASKKHSYVVYANGEVNPTRNFLFFHKYPEIKTGAELYVPAKIQRGRLSTGEAVGLLSAVASVLGLVVVLASTLK
jgi:protein involved in polysaccharide export with SLBB domain